MTAPHPSPRGRVFSTLPCGEREGVWDFEFGLFLPAPPSVGTGADRQGSLFVIWCLPCTILGAGLVIWCLPT
jgi:hypothetical protein